MRLAFCGIALGIAAIFAAPLESSAQSSFEDGDQLSAAMGAAESGDWASASFMASKIEKQEAIDVIDWMRLRAGEGEWSEYRAFLERNADWPGLKLLRKRGEQVLPSGLSIGQLTPFFNGQPPQTGNGALRLAEALIGIGRTAEARKVAIDAWTSLRLTEDEANRLLRRFGGALSRYNVNRLDHLLWKGWTRDAQSMLQRVSADWQALGRARIALLRGSANPDQLIKAVPGSLKNDPGLAHDRFVWRLKKDRWDEAEALLLERTKSAQLLGRPEEWSNRRRSLARRAMRSGDNTKAYLLASQHFLNEGSHYADLEWLSGWLALRKLNQPKRALVHFQRFRKAVVTPISLGRAGYWTGRAYEALGQRRDARQAYKFGAQYQTSFYGQLAAERISLGPDASLASQEQKGLWRSASFLRSNVFKAGLMLHYADQPRLTRRFFAHMAETMSLSDQTALAALALEIERPHVALRVAKEAAKMGRVIPVPYYPVTDLATFGVDIDPELAMAIARQESELDPEVVSPAGARGLMQVMPGTARIVAGELGLPYSRNRLTSDWRYNARLGQAYLAGLLEDFGGSYVLASAGYNAGPNRVRRWIQDYGTPGDATVDVVDWIETIPFRETRNYVMRILESLHVYRARINGQVEPIRLAQDLRSAY